MPRSFTARLAAIATAAFALRVLYVLVLARHVSMAGDSQYFHSEANLLADGHGFIEPFVYSALGKSVPTAAHPPLYPLALSVLSLAGVKGVLGQRLLSCVFGTVTLVLIGLIGRRAGGERVGLAAAAIAAVYPVLVAADGALMSESLYGLLIAAALLIALRLRERPGLAQAAALGVLLGLAALTRSEALLLVPLLALPVVLIGLPGRRLARAALVLAGCVLVLLPWSIRNASVFHEPTLISHNDSTVLAGANCGPAYGGADMGSWRFDCISPRTTFREGEQAATWRREGLRYARRHAARLLLVVPVRVLRTWDFWQPRRQVHLAEGRARWADEAGTYVYFVLFALMVAGCALMARRGGRTTLLVLLAPAVLVTISSALGWGVPRFRHAFEPSLVVLAAYAVVALAERRAGRRRDATMLAASPPRS